MKAGRILGLLGGLLAAGCVQPTLTNLTVENNAAKRDPSGLYPVEIKWRNNDAKLMHATIRPVVLVGATEVYVMRRQNDTLLTNRWVAQVPVDSKATELRYRIKVTWQLKGPAEETDSQLSREFLLRIVD